ncbi:MAG: hypothetical protein EOP62_22315 [Sphingomonadales bacterium]|nr:MAG: hypothetical protein EOP62_22315 [Sphingomonadales bacterium]
MIFVEFDETAFSPEVRDEARRLTEELVKLADDPVARSKFIDTNSHFWRQHVRPVLMKMSHGKCWYSEARDIVSVWHVDHFRPKGDVREEDGSTRLGYWWLAFKLGNYRLAGPVMNSPRRDEASGGLLGKWDRFPLVAGSYVAGDWDSDETLETPMLLDPCRKGDWTLITFDEAGRPIPNCEEDEFGFLRATISIRLLHLDFEPLNEERRRIWNKCDKKVRAASAIMRLPHDQLVYRSAELERIYDELHDMISNEAELSAVARACLEHSPFKWARRLATMSGAKVAA